MAFPSSDFNVPVTGIHNLQCCHCQHAVHFMTVFTKGEICVYIFILKDSDIGVILSFLWELGSLSILLWYIFISELKNK